MKKMNVRDGNGQLQEIITSPAYDEQDDALKVKSMQKRMRDSFPGAAVNAAKWDVSLGSGGSATVSAGVMRLGSGTVVNSESYVMTKETFTIPFRVAVGLSMTQRIANQSFYLEAISVNPVTGIPDDQNSMAWLLDGTVVTQGKYTVQAEGMAELVSASQTIPTSGTTFIAELEAFSDEAWFHTGTFDGTVGRSQSYRRHQRVPDPNAIYKIRLRWKNGGTAPASNTNVNIASFAVEDYAEIMAEVVAGRGNVVAAQAMAVAIAGTPATTSRLAPSATADGYSVPGKLISSATTNATSVRNAACNLGLLMAYNLSAAVKYLKIYNKASAPTVGTDTPIHTIPIPANGMVNFPIPAAGLRLSTGLALAITGGVADADATAVAANDVVVNWGYI